MQKKFTVKQLADMFGVHVETVRRWVRSGALRAHREIGKGKSLFVDADDLTRFRDSIKTA